MAANTGRTTATAPVGHRPAEADKGPSAGPVTHAADAATGGGELLESRSALAFYRHLEAHHLQGCDDSRGRRTWLRLRKLANLSARPRRHHLQAAVLSGITRLHRLEEARGGPVLIGRQALLDTCVHLHGVRNNRALLALHRFNETMVDEEPASELRAIATSLRGEAATPQFETVRPGIEEQLDEVDFDAENADAEPRARAFLKKALQVRNDHVEDQFITKSLLRSLLILLGLVMTGLLAAVLWIAPAAFTITFDADLATPLIEVVGANAEAAPGDAAAGSADGLGWRGFVLPCLLGALGATVSAMMNFAGNEEIPDVFTSFFVTLVRPLIGAASGIVAVFVLGIGLLNLGEHVSAYMLAAFAFGFSERLVLGAIGKLDFRRGGP